MKNIYDKAYKLAETKAAKAEHGFCTINGKLYTFVFKRPDWHYEIYEDGFFLVNVKELSLPKAKKYLKYWLAN